MFKFCKFFLTKISKIKIIFTKLRKKLRDSQYFQENLNYSQNIDYYIFTSYQR